MQQIIVSSGFYDNPLQMRSIFSNLDYVKNENLLQGQIRPMNFANNEMLRTMEQLACMPKDSLEFVEGSGTFILNQETDVPAANVSINLPDPTTQWVCILCLSESEEPHFLKFYRHKRTKWSEIPGMSEELEKENIRTYEDFQNFLDKENVDFQSKWQETTRIEYKFNDLVMFRPSAFHSYNDVYGSSKETGRLLQFFFLKLKEPPQN